MQWQDVGKTEVTQERLLLSPREAAKTLAISERSLYTYTRAGAIPSIKIGRSRRYALADLRAWIAENSEKSG